MSYGNAQEHTRWSDQLLVEAASVAAEKLRYDEHRALCEELNRRRELYQKKANGMRLAIEATGCILDVTARARGEQVPA